MSAARYARRVSAAEAALVAVPGAFIDARRISRSVKRYDLHAVERWLTLRSWARGARRADA